MSDSWLFAAIVTVALAATLWQFLVPVSFEVTPLGVRRYALGRVRLVPWQAIRAYQLRSMGVVFFQCPAPSTVDVVNGLYVPYPVDEDEVIIALQQYLPHATEFVKGPTA